MQWFPTTALETTSASQHSLSALRKKNKFWVKFWIVLQNKGAFEPAVVAERFRVCVKFK